MPDYELLTLMLSALKWRQLNGPVKMVTDSAGAAFFARMGLADLWDEPPDTSLDGMDPALDPERFWAAGKLAALRDTPAPCVMLDTDMIFWENIGDRLSSAVVAAHREELDPAVYPDPAKAFVLADGYAFPAEWDFTLPAANTAFLYMPENGLREYYVNSSFAFMRALRNVDVDPVVSMCFAEQRLLPMCAAARGVELCTLLDQYALDEQRFVTHLWGAKNDFAASPERRVAYCLGCVLRILSDFPEWESALAENGLTAHYLASLKE
ncbi:MAG: hypothetical protein IJV43_05830 [Oscillospiraceae bacterium]|nr:hypothetical protein [Oscillospiraceae bacterium]